VDAGALIRLPDGREGRVVYKSLDGIGIRWQSEPLTLQQIDVILHGNGGLFRGAESPEELRVVPQAMLRDPYPGCDPNLDYVGSEYEVVS
jgi:hypothetical protein